jgi:chromosome segregation ATPase
MLQMQQQLQRLQSDNAALQKERNELQDKARDADALKKSTETTGKELARARQETASQGKELASLRAELAATGERLAAAQTQIASLRKMVNDRDDALQAAALQKRNEDASQALLALRLKAQTQGLDTCQQRHAAVMKFSAGLVDRYESERLRLCEPITGIWKVHAETQIQQLREELYSFGLDVPTAPSPTPTAEVPAPTSASKSSALAPSAGETPPTTAGMAAPAAAPVAAGATAGH